MNPSHGDRIFLSGVMKINHRLEKDTNRKVSHGKVLSARDIRIVPGITDKETVEIKSECN